jgi:hypothetical protein
VDTFGVASEVSRIARGGAGGGVGETGAERSRFPADRMQ